MLILTAADAYKEAAKLMCTSSSVEYHGRFLRTLVAQDRTQRQRQVERERKRDGEQHDLPRASEGMLPARHEVSAPPPPARRPPARPRRRARAAHGQRGPGGAHAWHFPASPQLPAHPLVAPDNAALELELEVAGGVTEGSISTLRKGASRTRQVAWTRPKQLSHTRWRLHSSRPPFLNF